MAKRKPLKEFTAYSQVLQNRIVYNNFEKFEKNFARIKEDNENQILEIQYKVIDKAVHFFHRYYRAGLLPEITQSKGNIEQNKMHTLLKRNFLYMSIPSGNWKDIPQHYLTGVNIAVVENAELYNTDIPSRTTIIVVKNNIITGVIPSHAAITNTEMEQFIKKCEETQYGMIDFLIPPEIMELRDLAYEVMNKEREEVAK